MPFVKNFFWISSTFFLDRFGGCPSLLNHYSTYSIVCQEVFSTFFSRLLLPSGKQPTCGGTHHHRRTCCPLTDKGIIAHPVADFNRQPAQFWEKYFVQLFRKKCLTKCWTCGIMEISAPAHAPGPTKNAPTPHLPKLRGRGKFNSNFHLLSPSHSLSPPQLFTRSHFLSLANLYTS